jgi:hypothetical protein
MTPLKSVGRASDVHDIRHEAYAIASPSVTPSRCPRSSSGVTLPKLDAALEEITEGEELTKKESRAWYRIDLQFFHRRLRCLVVIDLKLGKFTHADAGQMHMYLNYASEHWTNEDENPPVGLILCAQNDQAVAHYTLDNLPNKVMAREYKLALPNEQTLKAQLQKAQLSLSKLNTEPSKTEN